ncbi:MAG: DNA polymerase IV, partial [Gammaproteobacteria bacterium]|nr:DNA polymerase IV [Gammaproteobacteria bacterium]
GAYLAAHSAHTCGDVARLPVSVLARRFGNLGRHIWLMCRGEDPDLVHGGSAAPKSLGHGKVLPPGTRESEVLLTYFLHMSEKVGARLRRHDLAARRFFIGLRAAQGWIGGTYSLAQPGNEARAIYQLCCAMMQQAWQAQPVFQVQVTALAPEPAGQQDLFSRTDQKQQAVERVMDQVNRRYGEFALAPARLLKRSAMPNVIAPSWKPGGHRQSI